MATQTREQGRYLGGRLPYGYRLADAGPHPNKVHAAWGRRAQRLGSDPVTAPVAAGVLMVEWPAHLPVPPRLHQRRQPRPTRVKNRVKNVYVREDQILPRLAALAILLAG